MSHLIRALWALSDAAGQSAVWLIDRRAQTVREGDTPAFLGVEGLLAVVAWLAMLAVYVLVF
jgi:hypothetical protein